tara:strand:+ start:111 stop:524 length:414 start_codon:yes stop_codon:yes gene_type:complete
MSFVMDTPIRILVFFPKGTPPADVREGLAAVQAATAKPVLPVDSLSWYETRFAACGNWDSWALEAATGKSYRDRQPYFHAFVVLNPDMVGQGTAKVVEQAIRVGKGVYYLDGKKLLPVLGAEEGADGWKLTTGGNRG